MNDDTPAAQPRHRDVPAVVAITREQPGRLADLLRRGGAEPLHVPLIDVISDDTADLEAALERLDRYDWLVVTSQHGARRVGTAAGTATHVKLAAIGTATAAALRASTGRSVDLVPTVQSGTGLVSSFPAPRSLTDRVLIAQADRAATTVAEGLGDKGYRVDTVVAYRTVFRSVPPTQRGALLSADAVTFASGSAAAAWVHAVGTETPPIVAAIGPATATAARQVGLKVTDVAADHSVDGLAATVLRALESPPH